MRNTKSIEFYEGGIFNVDGNFLAPVLDKISAVDWQFFRLLKKLFKNLTKLDKYVASEW